jgi:TRAP-type C4-dicarboxylate transport system substrate-binding protein
VKATLFEGGTLGKGPDYPEMIHTGALDGAIVDNNICPGMFPMIEFPSLPFLCTNRHVAADATYQIYYRGLMPGLDDYKLMWFQPIQPMMPAFCEKKVTKLEDWNGLRIRAVGMMTKVVEAWGATPVAVPTMEAYLALSQGMIDGTTTSLVAMDTLKWYEALNYVVMEPVFTVNNMLIMSKDTWNSLSPDLQYTLECLNTEARYYQLAQDIMVIPTEEDLQRLGIELIYLTPEEKARWQSSTDGIVEGWIVDMEAKGLPSREVVDVVKRAVAGG